VENWDITVPLDLDSVSEESLNVLALKVLSQALKDLANNRVTAHYYDEINRKKEQADAKSFIYGKGEKVSIVRKFWCDLAGISNCEFQRVLKDD